MPQQPLDPEIEKLLKGMYYKATKRGIPGQPPSSPISIRDRKHAEELAKQGYDVEQPVLDNSSILSRWQEPQPTYRPISETLPEDVHPLLGGGDVADTPESYDEMLQSQYGDANFLERGARNLIQGAYDVPDSLTGGALPEIGNIKSMNKAMDRTEYGDARDSATMSALGAGVGAGLAPKAIAGAGAIKDMALKKLFGSGATKAGGVMGAGLAAQEEMLNMGDGMPPSFGNLGVSSNPFKPNRSIPPAVPNTTRMDGTKATQNINPPKMEAYIPHNMEQKLAEQQALKARQAENLALRNQKVQEASQRQDLSNKNYEARKNVPLAEDMPVQPSIAPQPQFNAEDFIAQNTAMKQKIGGLAKPPPQMSRVPPPPPMTSKPTVQSPIQLPNETQNIESTLPVNTNSYKDISNDLAGASQSLKQADRKLPPIPKKQPMPETMKDDPLVSVYDQNFDNPLIKAKEGRPTLSELDYAQLATAYKLPNNLSRGSNYSAANKIAIIKRAMEQGSPQEIMQYLEGKSPQDKIRIVKYLNQIVKKK